MDIYQIEKKIRDGNVTISDVYEYAYRSGIIAGEEIFRQVSEAYPNMKFTESDALSIVSPILKGEHDKIYGLMAIVVNQMYKKAGTGLKAIIPEYNPYRENDVVEKLMLLQDEVAEDE